MKGKVWEMVLMGMGLVLLAGCASLNSTVRSSRKAVKAEPAPAVDVSARLEKAKALRTKAINREGVLDLVRANEEILEVAPQNYEALIGAGTGLFVLGGFYGDKKEQAKNLLQAQEYALRAMGTNSEFKKRFENGEPPWKAATALTNKELSAMILYQITLVNYCGTCLDAKNAPRLALSGTLSAPEKISNAMLKLAPPDPGDAAMVYISRAFYHFFPAFLGGSLSQAEDDLTKAIQTGKFGFAAYYHRAINVHLERGNREAYLADLQKALEDKLPPDDPYYPVLVHVQKDARARLDDVDKYFVRMKLPSFLRPAP